MRQHLEAIEQICSPKQLVTGLGLDPDEFNDHYTTTCPSCHKPLHILDTGFLCSEPGCDFRAGGVFDMIKVQLGLSNYDEALSTLENIFPDKFEDLGFSTDNLARADVVQRLQNRRDLFNFFRSQVKKGYSDQRSNSTINHLRSRGDIDLAVTPYCIFPLPNSRAEEFSEIMHRHGTVWPYLENDHPLLIPYFTNHHTVGVLVWKKNIDDDVFRPLNIEPAKFQFMGLMQAHPNTKDFTLTSSYARTLEKNNEYARVSPEKLSLHLLYKVSGKDKQWLPTSATYIENNYSNDWAPIIMLSRHTDVKVIPGGQVDPTPVNFSDRIVDIIVGHLKSEGFSSRVNTWIANAQLIEGAIECVRNTLQADREFELLQNLEKVLQVRVIDITGEGDKLIQREDGYFLERTNADIEVKLTNFTLDMRSSIVFADSKDLFHHCDLFFQGHKIETMINSNDLHNPKKLLEAVQRFPQTKVKLSDLGGLPVLLETTGRNINALMRYMKHKPGKLPPTEGISNLGWTHDRKIFYGPNFVASSGGINYDIKFHHPTSSILQNFDTEERDIRKIHNQLPLECTNLIAQAIAMIFRGFHGLPNMAVSILREGGGERLLKEMFGNIGQTHPFHFNDSQWSRGINTQGFPVYGTGANHWKTQKMKNPIFMLTERGQKVESIFDDQTYTAAGQTFRQVIHECLTWMLAGKKTDFEILRSVDPSAVLSKEGKRIIERAMGIEWHVRLPSYQVLDTLLAHIPFEETQQYMVFDLNKRIISLKLNGLPVVDHTDLELELRQFAADVQLTSDRIGGSAADLNVLFENYYQDVPKYEELMVIPSDT